MSKFNKILSSIKFIIGVIVIVFCFLGLTDIIDIKTTNNISIPLLGVFFALNGVSSFKTNKALAYGSFCVAGFILIAAIGVFSTYFRI